MSGREEFTSEYTQALSCLRARLTRAREVLRSTGTRQPTSIRKASFLLALIEARLCGQVTSVQDSDYPDEVRAYIDAERVADSKSPWRLQLLIERVGSSLRIEPALPPRHIFVKAAFDQYLCLKSPGLQLRKEIGLWSSIYEQMEVKRDREILCWNEVIRDELQYRMLMSNLFLDLILTKPTDSLTPLPDWQFEIMEDAIEPQHLIEECRRWYRIVIS